MNRITYRQLFETAQADGRREREIFLHRGYAPDDATAAAMVIVRSRLYQTFGLEPPPLPRDVEGLRHEAALANAELTQWTVDVAAVQPDEEISVPEVPPQEAEPEFGYVNGVAYKLPDQNAAAAREARLAEEVRALDSYRGEPDAIQHEADYRDGDIGAAHVPSWEDRQREPEQDPRTQRLREEMESLDRQLAALSPDAVEDAMLEESGMRVDV